MVTAVLVDLPTPSPSFLPHQPRPCLSWRDVQSLLVYTAVKVDVDGAQWVRNTAGFQHSDQHGFGLMDAYRMSRAAGVRE